MCSIFIKKEKLSVLKRKKKENKRRDQRYMRKSSDSSSKPLKKSSLINHIRDSNLSSSFLSSLFSIFVLLERGSPLEKLKMRKKKRVWLCHRLWRFKRWWASDVYIDLEALGLIYTNLQNKSNETNTNLHIHTYIYTTMNKI